MTSVKVDSPPTKLGKVNRGELSSAEIVKTMNPGGNNEQERNGRIILARENMTMDETRADGSPHDWPLPHMACQVADRVNRTPSKK